MLYGVLEERMYRLISRAHDFIHGMDEDSSTGMIKKQERMVIDLILQSVEYANVAADEQRDVRIKRLSPYEDSDRGLSVDRCAHVSIVKPFAFFGLFRGEHDSKLWYEIEFISLGKGVVQKAVISNFGVWKFDSIEEKINELVNGGLLNLDYKQGRTQRTYEKMLRVA